MKRRIKLLNGLGIFLVLLSSQAMAQLNPEEAYGELFREIQSEKLFKDQKTFVDLVPLIHPDSLLKEYRIRRGHADFDLEIFVAEYFDVNQSDTSQMLRHLEFLWQDLTRKPDLQKKFSSLLPLPNPYIIPGGRFREIYYWDSYFTMLGLQISSEKKMIANMVENFAHLIRTYGHIPNGNRSYYLSRSQPPFFALMVTLLAEVEADETILVRYLDVLEMEYAYWMRGEKSVALGDAGTLNRYWDNRQTPRPESYLHDIETLEVSGRDSSVLRDLRSAAESGWDFSTRWFEDGRTLGTIVTTRFLPVDLNCLLYNLERTIQRACEIKNDTEKRDRYSNLAEARKKMIRKYFWDDERGFYFDYDLEKKELSPHYTLAGLFPLFFNLADGHMADRVAAVTAEKFLKDGGLVTTLVEGAGQQWDYPNAWAPLQWISYVGLKNYEWDALAMEVARRWTGLNCKVYFETGKMMEKYDVVDLDRPGGGGEYEAQDGFGWTNGVFLKMWDELNRGL